MGWVDEDPQVVAALRRRGKWRRPGLLRILAVRVSAAPGPGRGSFDRGWAGLRLRMRDRLLYRANLLDLCLFQELESQGEQRSQGQDDQQQSVAATLCDVEEVDRPLLFPPSHTRKLAQSPGPVQPRPFEHGEGSGSVALREKAAGSSNRKSDDHRGRADEKTLVEGREIRSCRDREQTPSVLRSCDRWKYPEG